VRPCAESVAAVPVVVPVAAPVGPQPSRVAVLCGRPARRRHQHTRPVPPARCRNDADRARLRAGGGDRHREQLPPQRSMDVPFATPGTIAISSGSTSPGLTSTCHPAPAALVQRSPQHGSSGTVTQVVATTPPVATGAGEVREVQPGRVGGPGRECRRGPRSRWHGRVLPGGEPDRHLCRLGHQPHRQHDMDMGWQDRWSRSSTQLW
jgi:hypothetical protein